MKKGLLIALSIVISLVLLVHLAVQIVGNSPRLHEKVMQIAEENVDGALRFADLGASAFARFPRVGLHVDSLVIETPKQNPTDTVALLDRLYLELNPWHILLGKIKVNRLEVEGLSADVFAFLDVLPETSQEQEDTSTTSLPLIILDRLSLDSKLVLRTEQYGRMDVPLSLAGALSYHAKKAKSVLDVKELVASVAYMPIVMNANLEIFDDSLRVKADAAVQDCPLDTILRQYADAVFGKTSDFKTDASLSMDLSADGLYSENSYPSVELCLRLPESNISYLPDTLDAKLLMDVDAFLAPDGVLDADVHEFEVSVPGLELKLDGKAEDLLGSDPCYRLIADAVARLEALPGFVPEFIGADKARGDLKLHLDAHTHHSELVSYHFEEADIKGMLESEELELSIPGDSLAAHLFDAALKLDSGKKGLDLGVDFDSLYFNSGVNLIARVRDVQASGSLTKVKQDSVMLPRLQLDTEGGSIFVKAGSGRYGLRAAELGFVAQKRERRAPRQRRPLELLNPDRDFVKSDIDISLDSALVKNLRGWSTKGHVEAEAGFFASPVLPLRTRLTALHADFDDRDIIIDTIGVASGTSDLNMSGYIRGVKRALMRKGLIESRLKATSGRINVNEIVAALALGQKDVGQVTVSEESDESFVTDTLADASLEIDRIPLIVVPGNLDIELALTADTVNFLDPQIGPFSTGLKVKNGILQLTKTDINTDFGGIYLDAFYSTKSKSDISTGANLKLRDMEVEKVINLIPSVDSLMPILRNFHGKLAVDISATSQLDTNMTVLPSTLDGLLRIKGENMTMDSSVDFGKIANMLLFKKKDELKINNMQVDALIHESKIELFPFELGFDKYKLALRGTQNFDRSMYYHLSLLKSPLPFRVGVNLYGTLDNWRFALGRAKYREGRLPVYTQQLDNVQINLAKSISNIFMRSVDDVMKFNETAVKDINSGASDLDPHIPHHDDLSESQTIEYLNIIDNINLEDEMASQEEELMEEVEAALAASFVDTEKMMSQYQESIYDKKMNRKIEKLKRQSEKKAARQAAKQIKA